MAQAGGYPCSQTASPGISGRSGGSLQKRRRLPGPQDTAEAPPLGTPNTSSAAKLGGLAPHATGRVDHAGNTRHGDLCEIPTVGPHSSFATGHLRHAASQTDRQHPSAQGSTHWVRPSCSLEAVCFLRWSQPGCAPEFTGRAPPMPGHGGTRSTA